MKGSIKNIFIIPGGILMVIFSCIPVDCQVMPSKDTLISINDSVSIDFVRLERGSFQMGSPFEEEGRAKDEGPVHEVVISSSFYIGKYEVTQAQWNAVMGANPAVFKFSPQHPVESVSWDQCREFIESLNSLGKGTFRFPSEAEWEYACRAGTSTPYYWGETMDFDGKSDYAWANSRSGAMTHPVGQKIPNAWGLYDMSGNVWEWCSDDYGPYPDSTIIIEAGDSFSKIVQSDSETEKVFRGGSWFDFYESHRCANRHRHRVDKGYTAIGMRLVWEED